MGRITPTIFFCWIAITAQVASAAPWLDSRAGGLGLIGAASDHPASVHYNPAALSLQTGHHVFLDFTGRLTAGAVGLWPTDATTGRPLLGGALRTQDRRDFFPQLFLGLSSDLGTDSVVASVAVHTPFAERTSFQSGAEGRLFDPAAQGAARYHAVDLTMVHLFVTTSVALRLAEPFRVGVAISYVFGAVDFAFVRDAALEGGRARDAPGGEVVALDDCGGGKPCGYGSDAAAEAVRVRGTANGINFAVGVFGQPHRTVDLGLAFVSRVVGIGGENIPARGDAWVRRSLASLDNAHRDPLLANASRDLEGRGTISYSLPDALHLGAVWRPTRRLLLALDAHWLNWKVHDTLDIRLTGTQFRQPPQVPDRLVQYRGFRDVGGVQLGLGYQLTPRLALQVATMLETSAVPPDAVSAAAVDGLKVDSFVAARLALGRHFTLRAGYGLTLMPTAKVESSALAPADMVACVDGHFDVDLPECKRSAIGRGMASAAGEYRLLVHRLGLSLALDIW